MTARALVLAAALALVVAACGSGGEPEIARTGEPFSTTSTEATTTTVGGGAGQASSQVTVVAQNISFSVDKVTVPAGRPVTVTFDNRDAGTPHNFHVPAPQADDAKTVVQPGPNTQTLTFTVGAPGTYQFICDVHPDQMKGTLLAR